MILGRVWWWQVKRLRKTGIETENSIHVVLSKPKCGLNIDACQNVHCIDTIYVCVVCPHRLFPSC